MGIDIKRQVGLFPIQFNTKKKNLQAKIDYNIMGFLCNALIPVIDRLKESTEYKFGLKRACNDALREAEKANLVHFNSYHNYGIIKTKEGDMHSLSIHNTTAKAYDYMLDLIVTRPPSQIVSIVELLKRAEEKGLDLQEVVSEYTPAKI